MPFFGLLTAGILGAGGSIIGSALGANAASSAADQQAAAAEKALQFQEHIFDVQQGNQAPYIQAGQFSIQKLMQGLQDGTFGPNSIQPFSAPTIDQARASPGYQFAQQQGTDALLRDAAARGSLGSGSTWKNLQSFGTGLADQTYNDVFSRAMSGFQANLARQGQSFGQLAGTAGIGQGSAVTLGSEAGALGTNVGSLMTQIGNAGAAGTVGVANAINQGIGGVTNSLGPALTLPAILRYLQNPSGPVVGGGGMGTLPGAETPAPPISYAPPGGPVTPDLGYGIPG